MRLSPTTVLVLTSAEDVTANVVIEALNERGAQIMRVDPADVGPGLAFEAYIGDGRMNWTGRLRSPSREIALEEVGAVYYRRPTPFAHLPVMEREFVAVEAQHGLGGVLRSLHGATYVNHPSALTHADFKPAQLQTAAQLGLTVPLTLITNDVVEARKFAAEHGSIIYKSFRGAPSSPDGVAAIWTQRVTEHKLDESLAVTAHLFQAEVRKTADVRATVIGRNVFASRITTLDGTLDWRSGDWDELGYDPIPVPEPIADALHAYLHHFGLVFGCFDFALEVAGGQASERWTFIECNPNGQWAWLPDSDAMAHAFADVLLEGRWS